MTRGTALAHTEQGIYSGIEGEVDRFLGIAYAAPPVGDLRWRSPAPAAPHVGIRQADNLGADCPQLPHAFTRAAIQSEDCLTLNIWTPHDRASKLLPVLFWLPGGGFIGGTASDARTDGAHLAQRGMVVVTVNYRVGAFGYLAHPQLSAEAGGCSGNYGLADAFAAYHWVRRNIAAFGGDKDRITVGGVSAGAAQAALFLMADADHVPPPHQYLLLSPGAMRPLSNLREAEADGAAICSDIAALRALTSSEVLELNAVYGRKRRSLTRPRTLRPIVDGALLRQGEIDAHLNGAVIPRPALVGTVTDEGRQLADRAAITSASELRAFIDAEFGDAAERIAALYPAQNADDVPRALSALYGDTQFNCGAAALERSVRNHAPVWRHVFAFHDEAPNKAPVHGEDVAYTFGVPAFVDGIQTRSASARADHVADRTSKAIAAYITSGDPSWPASREGDEASLRIDNHPQIIHSYRAEQIDFLLSLQGMSMRQRLQKLS